MSFTIEDDAKPDGTDPEQLYRRLMDRLWEVAAGLGEHMDPLDLGGAFVDRGKYNAYMSEYMRMRREQR